MLADFSIDRAVDVGTVLPGHTVPSRAMSR